MLSRFAFIAALVTSGLVLSAGQTQAAETVRYRAEKWQAKHIHDTKKAETIASTLKKIGCEVKQEDHDGHFDVKYRCPKWKQMELKTHEEAHKWEKWLKEYGFETQHKHRAVD